jgi:hypothetical protein
VDVVLNHMTGDYPKATGVGGSTADTYSRLYPGVPYGPEHFNPPCKTPTCDIDYNDKVSVSDAQL